MQLWDPSPQTWSYFVYLMRVTVSKDRRFKSNLRAPQSLVVKTVTSLWKFQWNLDVVERMFEMSEGCGENTIYILPCVSVCLDVIILSSVVRWLILIMLFDQMIVICTVYNSCRPSSFFLSVFEPSLNFGLIFDIVIKDVDASCQKLRELLCIFDWIKSNYLATNYF